MFFCPVISAHVEVDDEDEFEYTGIVDSIRKVIKQEIQKLKWNMTMKAASPANDK